MSEITERFVVTARKWRPMKYEDVVGQQHVTTTLKNSIKSGRVHHAYLFCGPRGVGKTTTARIHAVAINAHDENFEPDFGSPFGKAMLEGRSLDIIEIDGASNNSVDDIRKLRENAKYPPSIGKYKVYIIDEVHMLSNSAFNALLKTLEEPPPHLVFIFATTETHKVPATIISRCQRFDFRRMEIEDITKQLRMIAEAEAISADEESLITIAKKGDGSMRDSQSIFDQVVAFCGKDIRYSELADALHLVDEEFYFRISRAVHEKDTAAMFGITAEIIRRGYDLGECLSGLLEHFRNVLTVQVTDDTSLIDSSVGFLERYREESSRFKKADLIRMMNLVVNTQKELRFSSQPKIRFEFLLVQLASLSSVTDIEELLSSLSGRTSSDRSDDSGDKKKTLLNKTEAAPEDVYDPDKLTAAPRAEEPSPSFPDMESKAWPELSWENITAALLASPELGLGMLIPQAKGEAIGNSIIIRSDITFVMEGLKHKKEEITNCIKDAFGFFPEIKYEVDTSGAVFDKSENSGDMVFSTYKPANANNSNADHTSHSSGTGHKSNDMEKHPVEKYIIEHFRGKEIEQIGR